VFGAQDLGLGSLFMVEDLGFRALILGLRVSQGLGLRFRFINIGFRA